MPLCLQGITHTRVFLQLLNYLQDFNNMGSNQEPPPQLQTPVCSQGPLTSPHIPKNHQSQIHLCVSNKVCAKPLLDRMHTATPFLIITEFKQLFNTFSYHQKAASKVKT